MPPAPGDEPEHGTHALTSASTVDEEFAALRDYVPGDDVRRIHWRSTARRGNPVVRQFDVPWQRRTTVLLDLRAGPSEAAFERAVSAAASVVELVSRRDELVRLVTTAGEDSGFVPAAEHLDELLDRLAVVLPLPVQRDRPAPLLAMLGQLGTSGTGRLVTCTAGLNDVDAAWRRRRDQRGRTARRGRDRSRRPTAARSAEPAGGRRPRPRARRGVGVDRRCRQPHTGRAAMSHPPDPGAARRTALAVAEARPARAGARGRRVVHATVPGVGLARSAGRPRRGRLGGGSSRTRRAGLRVAVSVAVQYAVGILVLSWMFAPGTLRWSCRHPTTWRVLADEVAASFSSFSELVAPVPATDGFLVVIAAAMWVIAGFADIAAVRFRAPSQAAVPYVSTFAAVGILAGTAAAPLPRVLFALALAVYAAAQLALAATERRWVGGRAAPGSTSRVRGRARRGTGRGAGRRGPGPATAGQRRAGHRPARARARATARAPWSARSSGSVRCSATAATR